jgi:hypothetical protein
MIPPIDPSTLPGPAQKIVSQGAPQKLQLMAARGIVPGLRPDAILSVLVVLRESAGEPQVQQQAQQTLDQLPEPLLMGALDADLPEAAIFVLAQRYIGRMDVLEKLIRMPRLPVEAVQHLAAHGDEPTTELIATNEERMLANPELIEAIYMNSNSRMSTSNRLIELAVRNGIELNLPAWKEISHAIQGELISEPSAEPLPEDEMFWESHELAKELTDESYEDAFFEDEEGEEQVEDKFKPLFQQIAEMTVAEKIRAAMLGTKEMRMMLIREQNKVVASAAARSPLLQEPEVALVTRSRGITDDVLRIIAKTPEWMKSYQIKRNLVSNPKTPIAIAQKLVTHLREADLRKLARNKNISGAVRTQVRRHLDRRKN